MKKNVVSKIGGQAVMEGVMMRGERSMATAVRNAAGEITVESKRFKDTKQKRLFSKIPVVRGVINFVQMMYVGVGITLRSAEVAGEDYEPSALEKKLSEKTGVDIMKVAMGFSVVLGILLAVALFVVLPEFLVGLLFKIPALASWPVWVMNLLTGFVRIGIFVAYIAGCAKVPEVKRLFMYHGAEHKTINCFEHGEELTVENVQAALEGLDESGAARIMVTNSAGLVLYDTRQGSNAVGEYALYSVVAVALRGQDASYCKYDGTAFLSRVATPVVYHNQIVGAVYAYDYDTEQAALLESFQSNLMTISIMIALLVAGLSIMLSRMLTRQISGLLQAIRNVREGAYSHRADASGTDEIAQIAAEFNSLTDRLQTTENARRRFVSDASHELKTPLAGIRLLSDSILQTEDIDAATVREFVGDIVQETDRLTRITENLLRLTRLDSGIVEPAQSVAVAPVIERVVRMLRLVADEKRVELTYLVEREQSVRAGVDDLHQIIYNLTENAIKYNRPGGFVRVTLGGTEDECVLRVEDNGIGIPEEDMPRVFDRFYRVDKMRSRAAGGTGLGLSIVADTVRRRGGSIAVSARAGGGTCFTVQLPAVRREGET